MHTETDSFLFRPSTISKGAQAALLKCADSYNVANVISVFAVCNIFEFQKQQFFSVHVIQLEYICNMSEVSDTNYPT